MPGHVKWDVTVEEAVEIVAATQEAAEQENYPLKILDVGGAMKPLVFATHLIDLLPYYKRGTYGFIPNEAEYGTERVTEDTWTVWDICKKPWPFEDNEFDIIWCSQTVEDVRDPIGAIEEMCRVGKAGYLDTIDRAFESLKFQPAPYWAGYMHHRWLIEKDEDRIKFCFKFPQLSVLDRYTPMMTGVRNLSCWWTGEIEAYEYIPMSEQEIEDYLTSYVETTQKQMRPNLFDD